MTRHALGKHSNGLATYPLGASITELEIECQLNKTSDAASDNKYEKAFFLLERFRIRKNKFPHETTERHLVDENDESRRQHN